MNNLHQSEWQRIKLLAEHDQLGHSFLFVGAEGVGKKSFALEFTKWQLCSAGKASACEKCKSCQLFIADNHPDFFELTRLENARAIKIDQIRHVIREVAQTPQISDKQIVLIEPAHAMNLMASNALLKSLEEPPGSVIFLLISSVPSMLPATVRSRCQVIKFAHGGQTLACETLNEELKQDMLSLSSGTMTPAKLVTKWQEIGYEQLLSQFLLWFRFVIRGKVMRKNKQFDPKSAFNLVDRLYELQKHRYHQLNMDLQMQLESLLNDWQLYIQRTV